MWAKKTRPGVRLVLFAGFAALQSVVGDMSAPWAEDVDPSALGGAKRGFVQQLRDRRGQDLARCRPGKTGTRGIFHGAIRHRRAREPEVVALDGILQPIDAILLLHMHVAQIRVISPVHGRRVAALPRAQFGSVGGCSYAQDVHQAGVVSQMEAPLGGLNARRGGRGVGRRTVLTIQLADPLKERVSISESFSSDSTMIATSELGRRKSCRC
jgi:hypothetical protein